MICEGLTIDWEQASTVANSFFAGALLIVSIMQMRMQKFLIEHDRPKVVMYADPSPIDYMALSFFNSGSKPLTFKNIQVNDEISIFENITDPKNPIKSLSYSLQPYSSATFKIFGGDRLTLHYPGGETFSFNPWLKLNKPLKIPNHDA